MRTLRRYQLVHKPTRPQVTCLLLKPRAVSCCSPSLVAARFLVARRSGSVLSSDSKVVKGWRYKGSGAFEGGVFGDGLDSDDDDDGAPFLADAGSKDVGSNVCTIEAAGSFNHFIISGDSTAAAAKPGKAFDSGLVLCAGEQSRCQAYYVPSLGVAPRWCSFLENITEELEEVRASEGGAKRQAEHARVLVVDVYRRYFCPYGGARSGAKRRAGKAQYSQRFVASLLAPHVLLSILLPFLTS